MQRPWHIHAAVLAAYTVVAIAFTWPLATHLGTHLTGSVDGDTGVYVWNQWVFRHEVVDNRSLPYFTNMLFGPNGSANLSLHNYTSFQNLIALPLAGFFGVVTTFNIVYLLMVVFTAYTTFLLARHVTRSVPESWFAGLLFAWSPVLVTRGMEHVSLVAAAPLAIFLLLLLRADGHERLRDAVALGATMALAARTDVYYAIYCLLIGAVFLVARVVSIEPSPRAGRARAAIWGLHVVMLCLAGLIAAMAVSGGWELTLAGRAVGMRSLYTPVLILTVLGLVRLGWEFRATVVRLTVHDARQFARLAAATALMAVVMVSPILYAAAVHITQGRFDRPEIFWRSSPPGIDLISLVLPNPNHPFAPDAVARWLSERPNHYAENVASLPFIAIAMVVLAWRAQWRPSRWWGAILIMFGLLALGPFIHVAGVNTYIPGPWALLRYIPLVGLAHTPGRFSIVLTLAVAIVFADALVALGRRHPARRRVLLVAAGALLAWELLPAPVTLYSAAVPPLYRHVAAAPAAVTLLEIPYGVRDGVSSIGNYMARTQFYQTAHGKTVMGGYLSRVSRRRIKDVHMDPVTHALALLSENRRLTFDEETALLREGPAFVRENQIGFVVIDTANANSTLQGLAIKGFRLRHIETNGTLCLYATEVLP